MTLLGVAVFHHRTLLVALCGLAAIIVYQFIFTGFKGSAGFSGLFNHLGHEWIILTNLFLLLMGFAILSRHFEESRIPDAMPQLLPDDWKGALILLCLVFVLSSFLDNIAAALIGGTVARHVFKGKVHIGYLAAIVAASNAGGSGSVVGDTTTTMMWIDGVSPLSVVEAYVAAVVAMLVFAVPASIQQQKFSPIVKNPPSGLTIDWSRVGIVAAMLLAALAANGRLEVTRARDADALAATHWLAQEAGIIPALESAHAVAVALDLLPTLDPNAQLLVNLSGRGDKDLGIIQRELGER